MAFAKADNRGDSYYTPPWCYEALPIDWNNYKTAFEPSMGDGRIFLFLEEHNIQMDGRDLDWQGQTDDDENFFHWDGSVDLIMGNPPFSQALQFMTHSLPRCKTLMFLLPLNFLASKKRYKDIFSKNPPDTLFVLAKRPSFSGDGRTASQDYGWFIWQQEQKHIETGLHWIAPP